MYCHKIQIRLEFEGEFRISGFPTSFENLCLSAKKLFLLTEDEIEDPQFAYIDEEGDKVNISNFYDFEQALIFAEKENLKILDLQLLVSRDCDIINETTNSIKIFDEKELLFREIDLKLNNLHLRDKKTISEGYERKLHNLVKRKLSKVISEFIFGILELAKKYSTIKKRELKKDGFIKPIYNKKFSDNMSIKINKKKSDCFMKDNELKELVKNVIEEEIETIKHSIIQKSIKKATQLLAERMNQIERQGGGAIPIHHGIKCMGCTKVTIIGFRYKCSICEYFNFCSECEGKYGEEHKHPFIKIRNSEYLKQPQNFKKSFFIDLNNNSLAQSNKENFNNYECANKLQKKFDFTKINEKLLSEILNNTKDNIDQALEYLLK